MGGVLGYARFPEFKEIAAASQAIANPLISIPFLFTFCVLIVLNKTGEGFTSFITATIPSLIATIILSAAGCFVFGLLNMTRLSPHTAPGYIVASLAGTAALLLVVQSWFKVPVPVRPTAVALASIRDSLESMRSAAKSQGTRVDVLKLQTAAFLTSAEALAKNPEADQALRARLQHVIASVKELEKTFDAPDVAEVQRRLGTFDLRDFTI